METHDRETLEPLLELTRALARRLVVGSGRRDALELVVEGLGRAFDVDGTSVTVPDRDGTFVVCRPHELEPLERLQLRTAEGPLHRAASSGEVVEVSDLATVAHHWPTYVPCATRVGIRAALAVPLVTDGRPGGALTLYRTTRGGCTETELAFARIMADLVATFLANTEAHREQATLVAQLQTALDSRIVLEQAKGMVAARSNVDVGTAFELIRSYARSHNQRIAGVAGRIVDGDPVITRELGARARASSS